jgi:hypothetical protein
MPISKNTKFDQESPVRNGNFRADFFLFILLALENLNQYYSPRF